MNYLQYHFTISPVTEAATDVLAALLAEAGFESFEPTETGLMAYVQSALLDEDILATTLNTFPLPQTEVTYTYQTAPNEDWNAQWETQVGFEPIAVGRRFVVFDDRYTTPIRIHPCQAFGCGAHATTRMILNWIAETPLEGMTVIDAGCGTGILGIAAKMGGARRVLAYDIDPWSVRNAEENSNLNGAPIEVRLGDATLLTDMPQAHLLLANINRNILLADMHSFAKQLLPEGRLVLSGFLETDVPLLTEAALKEDLHCTAHHHDNEWQMLVLTKNSAL